MEDREGVRWPREVVVSVVCIAGLAVCSGALVVLVPTLFRPHGQVEVWVLVVLAVLAAVFAIGGGAWRRAASPSRRRAVAPSRRRAVADRAARGVDRVGADVPQRAWWPGALLPSPSLVGRPRQRGALVEGRLDHPPPMGRLLERTLVSPGG